MKKFPYIAITLFFPAVMAHSADYYISNTPKGLHDCTSWENACVPSDLTYGGAHWNLFADNTFFYFDGGASGMVYNSPSITTWGVNGKDGSKWTKGVTFATGAKSPYPAGHDGYVTFDGQGTLAGQFFSILNWSHTTIDGEKNGAINWKFANRKLDTGNPGGYSYAIVVGDSGSIITSYATIKYVWVDYSSSGIQVLFNRNVEISYSKITNIYHETAIDARGFPDAPLGTNKIHHNQIENAGDPNAHPVCGAGVNFGPDGVQASSDVDIYNNTFTTRIGQTFYCQHPDQIQADWSKMRVFNNRFVGTLSLWQNSHEPTSSSNVRDLWLYNNVIIGFANGAQLLIGGTGSTAHTRMYFFNNTYLNTGRGGFAIPSSSAVLSNVEVRNNIFHKSSWNDVWDASRPTQCATITYSNNVVNGSALTCGNAPVTNTNGQTGMPSFVNYLENWLSSDVHLASTDTVATNKGIPLSSYFSTDKDGVSRPVGSPWAIGAYEYTGSISGRIPNFPTIISIN